MSTQPQQPSLDLPALRQQWNALSGAGAHTLALQGDAFAAALGSAMDAFANSLAEKYGVQLNELHWQRTQSTPNPSGRA